GCGGEGAGERGAARAGDRVVLGRVGRDDAPPRPISAAGAAGDLRQELEGPLAGAEVGQRQRAVGEEDADQRDAGEVVALGHHLRADEDVDLAARDLAEDAPEPSSAGGAGGVAVEPGDARRGEARPQRLLHPLGADAEAADRRRLAARAVDGKVAVVATVVAAQPLAGPMVGERDRAMRAAERVA